MGGTLGNDLTRVVEDRLTVLQRPCAETSHIEGAGASDSSINV